MIELIHQRYELNVFRICSNACTYAYTIHRYSYLLTFIYFEINYFQKYNMA